MVLLGLVHFLILLLAFRPMWGWRSAGTFALLLGGAELVAITECLGFLHLLSPGPLAVAWTTLTVIAAVFVARIYRSQPPWYFRSALHIPSDWATADRILMLIIVLLTGVSLVVAVIVPPNNWDSMTYHMSRVAQWAARKSVENYPTNIPRQLYQNPFAEYVILHLYVLAGGDRFANLVQWGGWTAGIVVATAIARELGATRRGQLWTATFVATLPMAVLQATNTQNDLVMGALLLIVGYYSLRLIRRAQVTKQIDWWDVIGLGLSAGLGVLTKGTGYLYILPWLLIVSALLLIRWRVRGFTALTVCATTVILLNLGFWSRNYQLYGRALGTQVEVGVHYTFYFGNDHFGPSTLVSNLLRNAALQLVGTPICSAQDIEDWVRSIHYTLRLDPDDPSTTWEGEQFWLNEAGFDSADFAGSPYHFTLVLLISLIALYPRNWGPTTWIVVATGAGFVLFSLYLRWQPWHARLHLPLLMLVAPVVGKTLDQIRLQPFVFMLAALLAIPAGLRLVDNALHPLTGPQSVFTTSREDQYVVNKVSLKHQLDVFGAGLNRLKSDSILLSCDNDDPEYLLWVFGHLKSVVHVNVKNDSAKLAEHEQRPMITCVFELDRHVFEIRRAIPATQPWTSSETSPGWRTPIALLSSWCRQSFLMLQAKPSL